MLQTNAHPPAAVPLDVQAALVMGVHTLQPAAWSGLYVPTSQATQAVALERLYVPAEQATQTDALAALELPASQATQTDALAAL